MNEELKTTRITTQTTDSPNPVNQADSEHSYNVAERIIWFISGSLITLLGIRFLLALLGANSLNPFANFIYKLSRVFVAPFFSLFNYDTTFSGKSVFELYTLIAMLAYGVLAYGATKVIAITRR